MSNENGSEEYTLDGDASAEDESVTPEDVRHVAGLARVALTEEEVDRFTEQFTDILDYFETLDEVPETDDEPELTNVLRTDEVREGLSQDDALRNAPETEDGYFKGPKVS